MVKEKSDDKKSDDKPLFNSSQATAELIDSIIISVNDFFIEKKYDEAKSLLESWYVEIRHLAYKKCSHIPVIIKNNLSFKELIIQDLILHQSVLNITDIEELEFCKNLNNTNKHNLVNLRRFHSILNTITNKIGLRVKLINNDNNAPWVRS